MLRVITAGGRAATAVPAWLALPGVGALLVSAVGYVQYQRHHPAGGLDLGIYRAAAEAFHAGRPVYDLTFALGLPYTYPPVTLVLLAPLTWIEATGALHVMMVLSTVAVFLTVCCATGLTGYRGAPGRIGLAGAVTGLALWLEPVSSNLGLGQVNAFLMLLVVADLGLSDRNPLKGVGVGVAAACKLVPGIFVVYLLLTRRFRAAAVAVLTFAATTRAGWVLAPGESTAFWLNAAVPRPVPGDRGHRAGVRREPVVARLRAPQHPGRGRRDRVVGAHGPCRRRGRPGPRGAGAPPWGGGGRGDGRGVHRAAGVPGVLVAPLGVGRGAAAGAARRRAADARPGANRHRGPRPGLDRGAADVAAGVAGRRADRIIWAARRQEQPLHWLGENLYVAAALGTMLLAARWLRRAPRAATGPSRPPRAGTLADAR